MDNLEAELDNFAGRCFVPFTFVMHAGNPDYTRTGMERLISTSHGAYTYRREYYAVLQDAKAHFH